jgi:type II secretory pathway pseudopilin PulG
VRKRLLRGDRGFSTLEIVVAVMIMGMVLAAIGPQFVGSFRATSTAKLVSQAKGVLQGQLDLMRALPFRVAPSAGDHLDLLDTYYRNTAAPSTAPVCGSTGSWKQPLASWNGYVAAGGSARCGYEPTGALYRYVIAAGTNSVPANFAVVLDTQFVSATTPSAVVAPVSTFDTQVAGRDRTPVQQVGVTATVLFKDHAAWKPVTVYSQIASHTPATAQIKLAAAAAALEIGSAAPPVTAGADAESLSLAGGQMELTGSLFNTSEANASLTSIGAASSVTGRQAGASLAVSAPYTNLVNLNAGQGDLVSACSSICWGATVITPFVVSADNGLPRAGATGLVGLINPVQTLLPDNATRDGFRFRTGAVTLPGLSADLVTLDATPPAGELLTDLVPNLVGGLYQCAPSLTGPTSHVTASGYLNSTDETAPSNPITADACGAAKTNAVRILPTSTAPDGLVRITVRSSARCTVTGAGHTPSLSKDYRAEVEYWKWTPSLLNILGIVLFPGHGSYVSAGVITPSTVTDPLASVSLASIPVSDTNDLGDYIESWAGLTKTGVQSATTDTAVGATASLTVPALVTIQTKPVRGSADPSSAVSISAGASSCYAEDNR